MTQPASHIDDDVLSALVDQQLSSGRGRARQRPSRDVPGVPGTPRRVALGGDAAATRCPSVEPPRDFSLGPRLVVDPPNVVRLRRWYTATRVAAGALAAMFVFLVAGTLFVDSRPGRAPRSNRPDQRSSAPAANSQAVAPTVAARAAAPAAPAAGLSSAPRPAANPQADDQVAAATSVSPLPTPVPTPLPTAGPRAHQRAECGVRRPDSSLTLGTAAVAAGLLALITAADRPHRQKAFATRISLLIGELLS